MPIWLIVILIIVGIIDVFFFTYWAHNYFTYYKHLKPPTGQVPVEEKCIISKEYRNEYAAKGE